MRAAVRDDREARLAGERAVVPDVRRPPRDLTEPGIEEERREPPLALGEVGERPEVDEMLPLLAEGRPERHHRDGNRDETADDGPEAEGRPLEESASREALAGRRLGHRRLPVVRRNRRCVADPGLTPRLRLDRRRSAAVVSRRVANPEEGEDDRDRAADRSDHARADDQADEDAGDPGREADRVERRRRSVRLVPVLGLHYAASLVRLTTVDSTPGRFPLSTTQ